MAAQICANQAMESRRGQWSMVRQFKANEGTEWAIKFRVVRFYYVPAFGKNGPTLELIVHDQESNQIHGQIKEHLEKYRTFFKEGELFAIRNFSIKNNSQTYRTVDNENIIQFIPRTEAKAINPTGFPTFMFQFHNFQELWDASTNNGINDHLLIDVIGLIVTRGRERTNNSHGRGDRFMEIMLEDTDGIRIGCTLWGEYMNTVGTYINSGRNDIIIILQKCRPRVYEGQVSVSTSYHVTKIILYGNSDAITDFRSRLARDGEQSTTSASIPLTPHFSNTQEPMNDGKLELTSVVDLIHTYEPGSYWVLGEISSIENYVEWFYLGCSNCNRKVLPEGNRFRCMGCKKFSTDPSYRFKVSASLLDSKAEALITLWDTECIQLLGKIVTELRDLMAEKTGNPDTFPNDEIKSFVGIRGLFKIKLKKDAGESSYNGRRTFGISEMITDLKVLKLYAEADTTLDDTFWHEEEAILSPEKIGSSHHTGSAGVGQKRKASVIIDLEEVLKKNLEDEFSSSTKNPALKMVKIEK